MIWVSEVALKRHVVVVGVSRDWPSISLLLPESRRRRARLMRRWWWWQRRDCCRFHLHKFCMWWVWGKTTVPPSGRHWNTEKHINTTHKLSMQSQQTHTTISATGSYQFREWSTTQRPRSVSSSLQNENEKLKGQKWHWPWLKELKEKEYKTFENKGKKFPSLHFFPFVFM